MLLKIDAEPLITLDHMMELIHDPTIPSEVVSLKKPTAGVVALVQGEIDLETTALRQDLIYDFIIPSEVAFLEVNMRSDTTNHHLQQQGETWSEISLPPA
jgi:hypothetical protein